MEVVGAVGAVEAEALQAVVVLRVKAAVNRCIHPSKEVNSLQDLSKITMMITMVKSSTIKKLQLILITKRLQVATSNSSTNKIQDIKLKPSRHLLSNLTERCRLTKKCYSNISRSMRKKRRLPITSLRVSNINPNTKLTSLSKILTTILSKSL